MGGGGILCLAGCVGGNEQFEDSGDDVARIEGYGRADTDICSAGEEIDVTIENHQSEEISVDVEIEREDDEVHSESMTVASKESHVLNQVVEVQNDYLVTVRVDEDWEEQLYWSVEDCFRLGVMINESDVAFDIVEPIAGPGDGEHDCYTGDRVPLWIRADESEESTSDDETSSVSATLTVTRENGETVLAQTYELEVGESGEQLRNATVYGETYMVEVNTTEATQQYEWTTDTCGWLVIIVTRDGKEIDISQSLTA